MEKTKGFEAKRNGTKAIFLCRLSYSHLDAPWSNIEGGEKKYSVSCIIPKDDKKTIAIIEEAIETAKEEGKAKKWKGSIPKKLTLPLRDGDEEREDLAYSDSMFMNASSRQKVPVLNRLKELIDPTEAYSGCYALVSVNFFPYDSAGNKGIGAGLNSVLKWADGEKLGGGDGSHDFDDIDTGLNDEDLDDL